VVVVSIRMFDGLPKFNRTFTNACLARAMPVWSFALNDDPARPDNGQGYIKAASVSEALRVVGDPSANLYPHPDPDLPAGASGPVVWEAAPIG